MSRIGIPEGIYFLQANSAFYRDDGDVASAANFMGQDFRRTWWDRRAEFPQMTPANDFFPY